MYINVESLFCTLETNMVLYVSYILIKKIALVIAYPHGFAQQLLVKLIRLYVTLYLNLSSLILITS